MHSTASDEISITKPRSRSASTRLEALLDESNHHSLSIGDLNEKLGDRAFALLMILFALPNLVPFPIPGISVMLGIPLIFLSSQLVMGRTSPWFPSWIANYQVDYCTLKKTIRHVKPQLIRIERFLKPRLSFLIAPKAERVIATICVILSVIITLPVPLGNWFPAFTICLFSLAILERDGLFVFCGVISTFISLAVISATLLLIFKIIMFAIEQIMLR
jgi:hypothetical protein